MASNVYAEGDPVDSDKDWYHGMLTRDQAEETLRASGYNYFLIRESKGSLVLSLIHHGDIYHIVIKRGPGGYSLSSVEHFSDLNELVSYYHNNAIITESGVTITLGATCRKTDHNLDFSMATTTGVYCKGFPADLIRYHWYYGKITEEETISVLYQEISNCYLVRQSANDLILSAKIKGWIKHFTINQSPEGYCLQGRNTIFKTIHEMITHYQTFPVERTQKLGTACDRLTPNLARNKSQSEKSFRKEVHDPFQVIWRKCADLPVARSAPSVVRIGDSVYVGGGYTKTGAIMKYILSQDTWMPLPPCPTYQHGLATLNGELIVIGGRVDSLETRTNKVHTFRNNTWMEVLPPMPTPRSLLSTASHGDRMIIAAGGSKEIKSNGEFVLTDVVEIYIRDEQWYTAKKLPFPLNSFSISIAGDTCYTLGGYGTHKQSCTTLFTTLSSLLETAEPADSSHYSVPQVPGTWKALEDQHPLVHSTITDVDGKIIALGGAVMKNSLKSGTKIISTYDFQSNSWVECKDAELPLAIYNTGVVKLADDEVMVVGGGYKNQIFSAKVYIGKILY